MARPQDSHAEPPAADLTDPRAVPEDELLAADPALRPQSLDEFVGQAKSVQELKIAIAGARRRGEPIDHVLLSGPPGLGKTTLAQIVANEMGYEFIPAAAPAIVRPGDLATILTTLLPATVLFLDEIHRLNKVAAEMLYTAMEDRRIDLIVGEGASARTVRLDLPPFTLIGATTRPGMLAAPFRHRFGVQVRLEYYEEGELACIVKRAAGLMNVATDDAVFQEIARRSRGTPRIAKRLLRRVRDYADFAAGGTLTPAVAASAFAALEVDANGLDRQDHRYLRTIATHFGGGPVGVETLAAALSEDRDILEGEVEPYLMAMGFLQRTHRGRQLTDKGLRLARGAAPSSLRPAPVPPPLVPLTDAPPPVQQTLDLGS